MSGWDDLWYEMSPRQRDTLNGLARHYNEELGARQRYIKWRRRGYDVEGAYRAVEAWLRNCAEQAARRAAHDTGYYRKVT